MSGTKKTRIAACVVGMVLSVAEAATTESNEKRESAIFTLVSTAVTLGYVLLRVK